jgi:5-methylcytosine-specific restriction endonuclease McrA
MTKGRGDLKRNKWRRSRLTILERDHYECQIRGPKCSGVATEVDHIIPHMYGGDSGPDNLRAACKPCNSAAGARLSRGRVLSTAPDPCLPLLVSLSGRVSDPQRRRTHRQVPG